MGISFFEIPILDGVLDEAEKYLPFLTKEEIGELNTILYTGKDHWGKPNNAQNYLNLLGKGVFIVLYKKEDSSLKVARTF